MSKARLNAFVAVTLAAVAIVGVAIETRMSRRTENSLQSAGASGEHRLGRRAVVSVEGLKCAACARRLQDQLTALSGVTGASVDLARRTVTLTFARDTKVADQAIRRVARDAGFQAGRIEWGTDGGDLPALTTLFMHGVRGPRCAAALEETLQRRQGVQLVTVDRRKDVATIIYEERHAVAVTKAIDSTGIFRPDGCNVRSN